MKEGFENSERKDILYIAKSNIDNNLFSIDKYIEVDEFKFSSKLFTNDSEIFKTALIGNIQELQDKCKECETKINSYSSDKMKELLTTYENITKEVNEQTSLKQELEQLNSTLEQINPINQTISKLNKNQHLPRKLPALQIEPISESITNNIINIDARLKELSENLDKKKFELENTFQDKNIKSITDAIQIEQNNIQQLNNEIVNIETAKKLYKSLQDSIPEFINNYNTTLQNHITDIQTKWESKKDSHNHKELLTDLEINVQVILDLNSFTKTLLNDFLNNKNHSFDSIIQNLFGTKTDSQIKNYCDTNQESWIITNSLDNIIIQEFFDMLSRKEGFRDILDFIFKSTTKGGDEWDVKTRMLQYIYSFSYIKTKIQLLYKDRPFEVLSAGEKGVISLLINIDTGEADIPLLIDQPEDYLDNNFIHSELIPILQEIKKTRQVIMVSHNANLVVNGDSEAVFVAKNISDESGEFDYISGSLESNTPLNYENFNENKSMKQRICSIMEGGELAFKNRSKKYGIKE